MSAAIIPAGTDDRPAAAGSAFNWKSWPLQADWSDVIRATKNSQKSADSVERQRAEGKKVWSLAAREPKRTAMVSIENAEVGRKSTDRRAAIRKGGI